MIAAEGSILLAWMLFFGTGSLASETPVAADGWQLGRDISRQTLGWYPSRMGSPYIPLDSWVYPAVLRLYSLGFLDNVFLGMRPWTRASVKKMSEQAGAVIDAADEGPATNEAKGIHLAIGEELSRDMQGPCGVHEGKMRVESVYSVFRGIGGTPLRDSFHLGSTVINDYGRPYENGFNNYTGASGYSTVGRFTLYVRGEYQAAPSAEGYSPALAQLLSTVDLTTFFDTGTGRPVNQ